MKRFMHPHTAGTQVPSRGAVAMREQQRLVTSSRTMAGMLLAAVVAAVLVVADQLIETWADGKLLVVWVGLWAITFALLSLLAPRLRQLSAALGASLARWVQRRAQVRAEQSLWDLAQGDHRLLAELRAATARDGA
ncbi:MAG: hypothetical protein ACR2I0_09350 [Rhodoferax sp.]